jgi:hypothetical protein
VQGRWGGAACAVLLQPGDLFSREDFRLAPRALVELRAAGPVDVLTAASADKFLPGWPELSETIKGAALARLPQYKQAADRKAAKGGGNGA